MLATTIDYSHFFVRQLTVEVRATSCGNECAEFDLTFFSFRDRLDIYLFICRNFDSYVAARSQTCGLGMRQSRTLEATLMSRS